MPKLVLPESLEHIGRGCFFGNTTIKELYLPESLQYTEGEEFGIYWNLEEVHIRAQEPPTIGSSTFVRDTNPLIQWIPRYLYVPEGCREKYEAADWWSWNFNILEEGQDRSEAGIDNVINDADESRSKCYDLMGRANSASSNGLTIRNGKIELRR